MPFDMEQEEYQEELRERETNMYQGKREEQVKFSEMMAGLSVLFMIGIILFSWIWKLI